MNRMRWTDLNAGYKDQLAQLDAMDPYELLAVRRGVSLRDLKRAYLAKVKAYHPDGADAFFKQHHQEVMKIVNRAYERIRRDRGHGL